MCWKGHCVVQASSNLVNILHSIGGGWYRGMVINIIAYDFDGRDNWHVCEK